MNHPKSFRMQSVQPAIIPHIAALIRQTPDTISLGQGVVHYPPPLEAMNSLNSFGNTLADHHYQSAQGIPQLQESLRKKLATENRIFLNKNHTLLVTAGSNMGFYYAIMAITDPGDEIIIMSPYYFNHDMAISMANCHTITVSTDSQYQLDIPAISAAITNRTKAIVTISPNNPTGAVYSSEDLRRLNALCKESEIYHITDEAYEYFTYDDTKHCSPGSFPNSHEHTISLFSFSKGYGLASWRVGYLVAPIHLESSLEKAQDTVLICPPIVSQKAAACALEVGPSYWQPRIAEFSKIRNLCLSRLTELGPFCRTPHTSGAFYILSHIKTSMSAIEIVETLITEYQIAVIPGEAFGLHDECYLRIAYGALNKDSIEIGMNRLVGGLKDIISSTQ